MTGPPRTPTALAIVRGNPGRRPLNAREPAPAPLGSLAPPGTLDARAAGEWTRYAATLQAAGVLTAVDVPLFRAVCEGQAIAERAYAVIAACPTLTRRTRANGPVPLPELGTWRTTVALLKALWGELGMTPAARSRIAVGDGHDDDDYATLEKQKPARRRRP